MMRQMSKQLTRFFGSFTVFKGAARELWLTFAIKFLIVAAFQVSAVTLVRWLSKDLGMSDQGAQGMVLAWAITMIVVTLLVGSLTDALGLRRTFFLGVWICLIARVVMALSPVKWVALSAGLFLLAVGEALGTPVLVAATRKYSNTQQRSMAFSLIYVVMNFGFLAGNYLYDWVRQSLGEYGHWNVPFFGWQISTYRTLFLVSWVIELLVLPVIWFLRNGVNVTDEGVTIVPDVQLPCRTEPVWIVGWEMIKQSANDTADFFSKLVRTGRLLSTAEFSPAHRMPDQDRLHAVGFWIFPKWGVRELGEERPGRASLDDQQLVSLSFLVPIIGALTQRFSAYRMVIVGGTITAISVFIMALPPQWFLPMANSALSHWIGRHYLGLTGAVHPYYVMTTIFIIILSFGEAFSIPAARLRICGGDCAPKATVKPPTARCPTFRSRLASKLFVATTIAAKLP